MKPIIGIITRPVFSEEKNKMFGVYEDVSNAIKKSGGIPMGIIPTDEFDFSNKCDGLIFQGGDEWEEYEKKYLEYAYEHNIPTLGICLGMQLIGNIFGGNLVEVKGHKEKGKRYVHEVILKKESKLYELVGKEKILVNSRHKQVVQDTSLEVVASTIDGITEAVEDRKKKFFIGVQWHPESMIAYDKVAKKIFRGFIDICRK